ncbi:hypothetical protein NYF23_03690 [SAR92 clade bacterium H455]|uniref:DUF5723 domain-containing protein n=1 Tax=SAR92 clade bacterium H455 TaxID=2974818 RepID=A0ABY5TPG0_9GAMM|nr:hypothetical protein NYF23_03690 [SAR92 clade bacterium H455]
MYSALHDLSGKFIRGDTAFTQNKLELGLQKGDWEFALLERYDYYLKFNPDTAELIQRDKNNLPLDRERKYELDISANHLHARGIKAAYYFRPAESFTLKLSGNLLYGSALLEGNIKGLLSTHNDDSFLLQATIDYDYSDDVLLNRQVDDPSGIGVSFDVAFDWELSEKMVLNARFDDLVNRIFWRNAPYTLADGTSATTHFDENGLLVVHPSLSGVEAERKHLQRLPVHTTLTGYYKMGPGVSLIVSAKRLMAATLPAIGYQLKLKDKSFFSLQYGLKNQALGLTYERENLSINLVSNALSFKDANTIGLSLFYQLALH